MRGSHECQCDRHDCQIPTRCDREETPSGHIQFVCASSHYAHLCEECASDPDCNGEALNPSPYESRSILSEKW